MQAFVNKNKTKLYIVLKKGAVTIPAICMAMFIPYICFRLFVTFNAFITGIILLRIKIFVVRTIEFK